MNQPAPVPAIKAEQGQPERLRVMVVDDSAVVRGIFRRILEAEPDIDVVASVSNGQQAIDTLNRTAVDVALLDIEMPVMDGMTALPLMIAAHPEVKVIMASTLTEKNAEVSIEALRIGASDYIPKPTAKHEIQSTESFKRELVDKIRALCNRERPEAAARGRERGAHVPHPTRAPVTSLSAPAAAKPVLRKASATVPEILAIGSSTGGPQALFRLFEGLRGHLCVPVVIAQHMPKAFTAILAEHLAKVADVRCAEGQDGEELEAGRIYIAPGDYHMVVERQAGSRVIRLNQEPPENFCRPSVEPLFRSVTAEYGTAALALMLTGMGHDGLEASRMLVDAGGTLIAQDEESSVVWGMPGAVAMSGLCADILPIEEIAPSVRRLLRR